MVGVVSVSVDKPLDLHDTFFQYDKNSSKSSSSSSQVRILGILSSISLILALYTSFLNTKLFTTRLILLKSIRICIFCQHLIYLLYY